METKEVSAEEESTLPVQDIRSNNTKKVRVISETLTVEDVKVLQAALIDRLSHKMMSESLSQAQLAKALHTTPSYVTSIFNGLRWVPKSDRSLIDSIASYLDVPVLQIFIWAGFFEPNDLVVQNNLIERLNVIYQTMSNDPMIRHIAPGVAEWNTWNIKMKTRFVMLYEITSSRVLLEHAKIECDDDNLRNLTWILNNKSE